MNKLEFEFALKCIYNQSQHRMIFIKNLCFKTSNQRILFTGIQPTGSLHLGNYLGSVTNILRYQQTHPTIFLMIADYHSLTTAIHHQHSKLTFNIQIKTETISLAKVLIASGVDTSKVCLFVQSKISAHAELAWILSCLGPQHWLNTMIQFKEKSHQNSSVGLYTYPILMASDILLYRSTDVPVGVDQAQHIELAKKLAERFNSVCKQQFFPQINYIQAQCPKVMSLTDPLKKMSKSDPNQRSRINLSDSIEILREKIRRAPTDAMGNFINYDVEKRPGLANLLTILSAVSNQKVTEIVELCQKNSYGISKVKEMVVEEIGNKLQNIQKRYESISNEQIIAILERGRQTAQVTANRNLSAIKSLMNLYM